MEKIGADCCCWQSTPIHRSQSLITACLRLPKNAVVHGATGTIGMPIELLWLCLWRHFHLYSDSDCDVDGCADNRCNCLNIFDKSTGQINNECDKSRIFDALWPNQWRVRFTESGNIVSQSTNSCDADFGNSACDAIANWESKQHEPWCSSASWVIKTHKRQLISSVNVRCSKWMITAISAAISFNSIESNRIQ